MKWNEFDIAEIEAFMWMHYYAVGAQYLFNWAGSSADLPRKKKNKRLKLIYLLSCSIITVGKWFHSLTVFV